ncbi:cyanidin-3-O-glucoside 2-O-glucuronosyltransferase-like [Dorcoceras hygrometricum]|uniref:Cyanidin-3-O-glucoside 2-O-glucuronosyltransferase-like n=1 Tax=Dorcoceras hygrometricum TaxID=472368 RepID=A0A2Z7BHH2_9LAMI|nr:cyanidin-3-O-glucoside 2-O-glucuronosyltransferase-like [Dorcoceras hygrometricum]
MRTGPVELPFMYYELMDPCVHDMVKQHRGVRDPEIEHAEPLGSLGLNGTGDDHADEYIPTGGKRIRKRDHSNQSVKDRTRLIMFNGEISSKG